MIDNFSFRGHEFYFTKSPLGKSFVCQSARHRAQPRFPDPQKRGTRGKNMDNRSPTKLRRWEVWQRQDGTTYLTWGTKDPPIDSEKLVSTFYSANWLSAEREAFGSEPEIDEGIQPLVEVVQLFAGVMTMAACQGHPDRGDDCAVLGLTFDDVMSLKGFTTALREVALQEPPLSWDLRLDESRTLELPIEAFAFELMIFDEAGVPDPELLRGFAQALLAVSGIAGVNTVPAVRSGTLAN